MSSRRADGESALPGDWFGPIVTALIAMTWLSLLVWQQSPFGRYLDHDSWLSGWPAAICRTMPGGEKAVAALLHIGGWLLMSAAMMLPTVLPLLFLFRRITAGRRDRNGLTVLLAAGYLAVWTAFAVCVHAADAGLHVAVRHSAWLTFNAWVIGATTFVIAGSFQFTRLKYFCLDRCRSPRSFLVAHWSGGSPSRQSFALGAHHGLFCVGCCWALMLLMFAVGLGSLAWMAAIGAVMAIEKNMTWGRRLSAPLGAALLSGAALVVAQHL